MRVLFASSVRGWGGGEEWFVRAPQALAERGHDVRVAARRGSVLARRARERGLAVAEIDYGGLLDPRGPLALARALAEQDTDVAVANLDKELAALALAGWLRPEMALVARRGSDFPVKATALGRWLHGGRVDRILVNSRGIADTLANGPQPIDRRRIEILANGLDPLGPDAADRTRRAADWPPGPGARLIAVGELSPRKDPLGVLDALAALDPPWRLLWIGGGPLRPEIEERLSRAPWAGHVRLLGEVAEARRWTAAADALVHFSSSEGQPWAVLEALIEGVPVVVSRMPGLADLVQDGPASRVVEAGDVRGLASALGEVLADPQAARSAAAGAAVRVREAVAEGPIYDRLERLLEAARAARRRARRAVFLDRDGTLTLEVGTVSRPEELRLLPGVGQALRALARAGYALVVITNQAAIGRGRLGVEDARRVAAELRRRLRAEGVELAGVYLCPHAPEAGCACRKPAPGLVLEAAATLGLSLSDSWVVGDSTRDVEAARRAGTRAILLGTGWAGRDPAAPPLGPADERELLVPDLTAAARRILAHRA